MSTYRLSPWGAALLGVPLAAGCGPQKDQALAESASPEADGSPIANAGPDQREPGGAEVLLDGRGSFDPDGDLLVYHWSFDRVPDGSRLASDEAPFTDNHTTVNSTTFLPDRVGTYIVRLVVEDDGGDRSDPDYAVVSVLEGDQAIADAGEDQSGVVGQAFTLDGSGSYDPLGRPFTYAWRWASVPGGSAAELAPTTEVLPGFTADVGGLYIASLVVNNGLSDSAPDLVMVRVRSPDPQPPTAEAGADQTVMDCVTATVDGSGSYDPNEEETLDYLWSIQEKPAGSLASDEQSFGDREAVSTSFWPDVAGDYVLSLTVFDGSDWSVPDTTRLTATERIYNSEPSVYAGADLALDAGTSLCTQTSTRPRTYACAPCPTASVTLGLDAAVTDLDGDPTTARWEVTRGDASLTEPDSLVTTAILWELTPDEPEDCVVEQYTFTLEGTDCPGESVTDRVTVKLSCCGVKE